MLLPSRITIEAIDEHDLIESRQVLRSNETHVSVPGTNAAANDEGSIDGRYSVRVSLD